MKYEQSLTAELRYRGTPESDIADILAEVRAHTPAGEDPVDHFGTPTEYAEQYTTQRPAQTKRKNRVLAILVIIAVMYTVFALLAKPLLDINVRDYTGPFMLWPALALILAGTATSFIVTTFKRAPHAAPHSAPNTR
ncbi:hypothetical protein [Arthrobacter flavus]|uniref:DUF1707 domain-containing protein n=1 Tax=Arthrobacter flavus TaxID=95172 RepID=A0ABW4Q8L3_9MICC